MRYNIIAALEYIEVNTHMWEDKRYEEFVKKTSTRRLRKEENQDIKKTYEDCIRKELEETYEENKKTFRKALI